MKQWVCDRCGKTRGYEYKTTVKLSFCFRRKQGKAYFPCDIDVEKELCNDCASELDDWIANGKQSIKDLYEPTLTNRP